MKDEPAWMFRTKISLRRLVCRKTVPNEYDRFFEITMDEIQVENDLVGVRRAGIDGETKSRDSTFRRQRDETDAGFGRSLFAFVQNRNMAPFGPGSGVDRDE